MHVHSTELTPSCCCVTLMIRLYSA